jgi:hypothetical protein
MALMSVGVISVCVLSDKQIVSDHAYILKRYIPQRLTRIRK